MEPRDATTSSSTPLIETASRRVHGQITTPGGWPAAGVLVRAFDRDLRSEKLLGESTTDGNGNYEITYDLTQLGRPEKGAADLVVRALPEGTPAVDSPIR